MQVQRALDFAIRHRGRFLEELIGFVRHPSVSAAPKHAPDVARCAEWLAKRLAEAGLERVRIVATSRHPIVTGEWLRLEAKPTLLVYGHYDVQPVDPIGAWRRAPFEPSIEGAHLYGRGASDDKGQLLVHVKAIESCLRGAGALPINVQCVFEGEEEIGSPNLEPKIKSGQLDFSPDAVVVSDMAMAGRTRPAITYASRGNLSLELEVSGPGRDLHSGVFGGTVHNPAQALCEIIGALHDDHGRIAIPGVYERVRKLTLAEKRRMRRFGPSDEGLLQDAKAERGWGEPGFTAYERATARPALTINGLSAGYSGPGSKGVIPASALAKLSFRLVADQDPDEIDRLFRSFVVRVTPPTVRSTVRTLARAAPTRMEPDNFAVVAAAAALRRAFGAPPALLRSGGTLPVADLFQRCFEVPVVLIGFGQRDDRMHAPNERFHLPSFFKGIEASIWLMSILGGASPGTDERFSGGLNLIRHCRGWPSSSLF